MSRASKITLALTTLSTAGVVWLVHWSQQRDLEVSFYTSQSYPSQVQKTINLNRNSCYTPASSAIWRTKSAKDRFSSSAKRILKCRSNWKLSIARSSMFLIVLIQGRNDASLGGGETISRCKTKLDRFNWWSVASLSALS